MHNDFTVIEESHLANHGSLSMYVTGFLLSLFLTIVPYFMVTTQKLPHDTLILVVLGLAMLQLLVQIIFFLHLSKRSRAKWNLIVFVFTVFTVVALAAGSIWVMNNLNTNMAMTPLQLNEGKVPQ